MTQSAISRGEIDVPFDVQWIGRPNWLYPLQNLAHWGYGWPFLLSALAGFGLLIQRWPGRKTRVAIPPLLWMAGLWALALLAVQGAAFSKFTRYYLPLTPVAALLAAWFWSEMARKKPVFRSVAAGVAALTALWALAVTSIYSRENSRAAASRWMLQNIAPGALVASETAWDEVLPLTWMKKANGDMIENPFHTLDLAVYDRDLPLKRAQLLEKLDSCQWIVCSSPRAWATIPRWPQKWPFTSLFYRALFDGKMGFRLEREFVSYPRLGPFQFPDGGVEEALTVYDHPRVLIFRKTTKWSRRDAETILAAVPANSEQGWTPNLAPPPDEKALPLPPVYLGVP